ncbi:fungal-specific transcription factor domain-containing protein [Mycena maculata]|uniref:Fungal-specific transcription factor domain-containing protein n=1 Tax=Mycena maculata TaxID=230809 RepID=A0AAD7MTD9_9AGAR|nr:fungal-specific transcription factor domain-containing protein [Mycena maculata]
MASNDEGETDRGKAHHQRACDVCRRRKSGCEGSQRPGDKCLTCLDANLECTYIDAARQRITKSRYVVDLEKRLEHSEVLNHRLRTEIAKLRTELSRARLNDSNSKDDNYRSNSREQDGGSATLHILRTELQTVSAPAPAPHAEDLQDAELERQLEALSMDTERGFYGKSSNSALVKAAIDLKAEVRRGEHRAAGQEWPASGGFLHTEQTINPLWTVASSNIPEKIPDGLEPFMDSNGFRAAGEVLTSRRLHYWTFKPWNNTALRTHAYSFPPPDLAAQLIDLYFTRAHVYIPLLHRQTFERSVGMGVHHWDNSFAATMLLVCAIGSRWSDDPRVLASPGGNGGRTGHLECGWEWFNQVPPARKHLFGQATLYDLQYFCLAVHFLLGTSVPRASWMFLGIGLRLALDAGAHRRTSPVEEPSVEREQWKRAFWVMVYLDGYVSSLMGRACAIQYDDFDLDPLLECDDEYWEHPTHPFQQPHGVPSRIVFFNSLLRLNHILSLTLKILYSLRKVRAMLAIDAEREEHFVADLDSALNRWRDQVPEHLSWDPERTHPVFFDQSVALNCAYYHLQILIHRSFIPPVRKEAPTGLPSMAICTSAARACTNMLDLQRQRKGNEPVNFNMSVVFTSALVLLLNVWSGKRTGSMCDPSREIANVHKCMEVIRLCDDRWQNAGILWYVLIPVDLGTSSSSMILSRDILSELVSLDQPAMERRGVSFDNSPGQQQANPTSTEDMLHLMLKWPRPQQYTSDSRSYDSPDILLHGSSQGNIEGATIGGTGAMGATPMHFDVFPTQTNAYLPSMDATGQASREMDGLTGPSGDDWLALWLNVPTGFQADELDNYLNNFSEFALTQEATRGI